MKEIITNKGTFLFVEVPDNFIPQRYGALDARNNCIWGKNNNITCTIPISEKDFSIPYDNMGIKPNIISTTKDITEEEAKNIVEKPEYGWYLTYTKGNKDSYHCQTAKESLESLLKANGIDITKNYLILEKHVYNKDKE